MGETADCTLTCRKTRKAGTHGPGSVISGLVLFYDHPLPVSKAREAAVVKHACTLRLMLVEYNMVGTFRECGRSDDDKDRAQSAVPSEAH